MISPAFRSAIIKGKVYGILRFNVSDTLRQFNLTMPQWTMLGQLSDTPGIRPAELAELSNRVITEPQKVTGFMQQ